MVQHNYSQICIQQNFQVLQQNRFFRVQNIYRYKCRKSSEEGNIGFSIGKAGRSPFPLLPSGLEVIAEIIGILGQEEGLAARRFTSTEAKLLLIGRGRMYERLNSALSGTKAGKGM